MLGDNVIVATSDVHLGYYCSDENLFKRFLDDVVDTKEVTHFVLVGDILDMLNYGTTSRNCYNSVPFTPFAYLSPIL
jgi:UDP-2,3-diacylglucosamine pyrophosphatase LpxH